MSRSVGTVLLWVLAGVSILLLIYEATTLMLSVVLPLLENPQALQTDFHYYYEAAVRFSQAPSQLYSASDDVIAGFAYPPPAIIPFVWLTTFPLGVAFCVLTLASYGALSTAIQQWVAWLERMGYRVDRRTVRLVLLIALAIGPTYMNAVFGQVNTFVLLSVIGFVTFIEFVPQIAGTFLALGMLLKIYPALMIAMVAWRRDAWRSIAFAIAAMVVFAVLLQSEIPWSAYVSFARDVLPSRIDKTAIHITNQSLVAFLERFRFPSPLFMNWTGEQAVTVSAAARLINLVFGVAAIATCWWRAKQGMTALSIATLIALIAVVAPLGWGHTYVMALPLVILQLIRMKDASPSVAIAIFLCVLALMVPAGRHLSIAWAPDWLENVVYSRYLVATIALMLISSLPRDRTTEDTVISSA